MTQAVMQLLDNDLDRSGQEYGGDRICSTTASFDRVMRLGAETGVSCQPDAVDLTVAGGINVG